MLLPLPLWLVAFEPTFRVAADEVEATGGLDTGAAVRRPGTAARRTLESCLNMTEDRTKPIAKKSKIRELLSLRPRLKVESGQKARQVLP